MRSIICLYGRTSGPPTSKLCPIARMPRDGDEIADDVGEGDRLRRGRHPSRRDHRRQAVDERHHRLEARASPPDDDGGTERGDRHGARRERGRGLDAAAQVRREVAAIVSEPAQVHDLAYTRSLGLAGDDRSASAVELREVGGAERVDEVVDDVDSLEHVPDRVRVRDVRLLTAHTAVAVCSACARPRRPLPARRARERAHGRSRRWRPGRRPSRGILVQQALKYRRLTLTCRRRWSCRYRSPRRAKKPLTATESSGESPSTVPPPARPRLRPREGRRGSDTDT